MAKKKSSSNIIGGWAFLIGVILAVVLGAFGAISQGMVLLLVVIGVIVGLLNIADEEAGPFLMSGAVLIIASALSGNALGAIPMLDRILNALLVIFVPATIIVAIRNVLGLARN